MLRERAQEMSHMWRLWPRLICFAAVLAAVMAMPAAASPVHRIVAVGDLHGDFSAWRDIARAASLVDDAGRWIGGTTILVQTGDVVDRGPDSLKIMLDLMRLQTEAARAHGQLVALVGNHEAMNVTGDLRYVSAGDYAALTDAKSEQRREATYVANKQSLEAAYRKHDPQMTDDAVKQAWFAATPLGSLEHLVAWRPDGRIGQWVIGNPAVALIDGNLFVHGGISPAYADMPIAEINRQVKAALMAKSTDPKAIINDELGPLWYRGLVIPQGATTDGPAPVKPAATAPVVSPQPPIKNQVEHLLTVYGAKRIVIGHTPILSGIAMLYDDRLICIDTGISAVYGGKVTYLEILDGVPIAHIVERTVPLTK